jgi:Trk K+ transport system NAD-binding subunit
MKDHIVVCGLGHVGIRVVEHLVQLGEKVVVIEKAEQSRFLDELRKHSVPVVPGDMRLPSTLERANTHRARSLIAAASDDLANLETALSARAMQPSIRIVLRIFDHNLADKIASGFGIRTTFSTAALAAPAFAMAAVDPAVVGCFHLGDDLLLIMQLEVAAGSSLVGTTAGQLSQSHALSVLCHEAASGAARRLHPADDTILAAADKITISASCETCEALKRLNRAVEG